ncbi:MAG: hypothetical protein RIS47_1901 [Bacteroidota bacterium]|jgi:hypothetical protein
MPIFQKRAVAGCLLVGIANGNRVTWPLSYFSQTAVQKAIVSPCCGLPLLFYLTKLWQFYNKKYHRVLGNMLV